MPQFSALPLGLLIVVFAMAALVVLVAGSKMAAVADELADRTGLGEALIGAVLLGASTSLSGSVTSISAAWQGSPQLAIGNAFGGIAVQTAFLGIADLVYRKANLEHAAASIPNLLYGTVLVVLLASVLVASQAPNVVFLGVHPATPTLLVAYGYGLILVRRSAREAPWLPRRTTATVEDHPDPKKGSNRSVSNLIGRFVTLAVITGVCGLVIGQSGIALSRATQLSETFVGALFTSVSTSTPELVTAIAAVRRGALTLAVGGIIGGNAFDVLFIAAADVAYRPGSIYHVMQREELFLVSLAILMTGVLLTGLLYRQERGIGKIGFESVGVLAIYVTAMLVLALGR